MKDLLKSDKLIKFAFISGIVAIALIFLSDFGKSTEAAVTDEQALEQRITEMLTAMDGIDEVPNVTVRLDEDKHTVLGITVVCPQAISNRTAERAPQCAFRFKGEGLWLPPSINPLLAKKWLSGLFCR